MTYSENKKPDGLDSKAIPVDNDVIVVGDSVDSGRVKKTTWQQVKSVLKTYFDTLYQPVSAVLSSLASLTPGAEDRIITSNGLGGYAMTSKSDFLSGITTTTDTIIAYKTADTTKNNTTTPGSESDLFVTLSANAIYSIECLFIYDTGTIPDIKVGFRVSDSVTEGYCSSTNDLTNVTKVINTANNTRYFDGGGEGSVRIGRLVGYIDVGDADRYLMFIWAQNTSYAGDTILKRGSWLKLTKLNT